MPIYAFKLSYITLAVLILSPRGINYIAKSWCQPEKPFYELLANGIQEILKTIYVIAVASGCLLEPEGKTFFLKTLQTANSRFRGIHLDISWRPPL